MEVAVLLSLVLLMVPMLWLGVTLGWGGAAVVWLLLFVVGRLVVDWVMKDAPKEKP